MYNVLKMLVEKYIHNELTTNRSDQRLQELEYMFDEYKRKKELEISRLKQSIIELNNEQKSFNINSTQNLYLIKRILKLALDANAGLPRRKLTESELNFIFRLMNDADFQI